jgi:hypothetical protein
MQDEIARESGRFYFRCTTATFFQRLPGGRCMHRDPMSREQPKAWIFAFCWLETVNTSLIMQTSEEITSAKQLSTGLLRR